MPAASAGILLYRLDDKGVQVLLVHPGGPYWSKRDLGSWSIPKGEYGADETPEIAARREFAEETGRRADGPMIPLGTIRQKAGKRVEAFALEGDFDVESLNSELFELEWPPRSGRLQSFPEVDRAAWFNLAEAHERILAGQRPFLDRLAHFVADSGPR
jgi:predicted NUDIX family NTP pyrophosphohydrolase